MHIIRILALGIGTSQLLSSYIKLGVFNTPLAAGLVVLLLLHAIAIINRVLDEDQNND